MIKKPVNYWTALSLNIKIAGFICFCLINGCTIHKTKQDRLPALNQWSVKGKIGLRNSEGGFSGSLFWEQLNNTQAFTLMTPLGTVYAKLTEKHNHSQLYIHKQGTFEGHSSEQLIMETLGYKLPLSKMKYWVQGKLGPDASAEHKLDEQGRLVFVQHGTWVITIQNYQYYGDRHMPSKIRIENGRDLIKLRLRDWTL